MGRRIVVQQRLGERVKAAARGLRDRAPASARLLSLIVGGPQDAIAAEGSETRQPQRGMGLSSKLLLLTALFVMLAEILIFLPSVANFRVTWLTDRLTAARLASLAADAVPDHNVPANVRLELLQTAKVQYVAIKLDDMRRLVLPPEGPINVDRSYDMRRDPSLPFWRSLAERFQLIGDALRTLVVGGTDTIRVFGHPAVPHGATLWAMDDFVEIVLPETPLRDAMWAYALNIMALSIIISMIAAALVYVALNRLLVKPILRLSGNMEAFGRAPENASLIIEPSARSDEIGTAERELQHMQQELRSMLNQKNHLAALGLAVSKISHDLRNMLATAQLLSDRLTTAKDPSVQSFAPKLISSLDRAINLCNDTLRYGRAAEAEPRRLVLPLAPLAEEVAEGLSLPRPEIDFRLDVAADLDVDADPDQLYRILNNLVRNAVQVIEQHAATDDVIAARPEIVIHGRRHDRTVVIDVRDTGPGVSEKARAGLFKAFQAVGRKGGTGLGLAIAAELATAHGGKLELVENATPGATFRLTLPDR